MWGQIAKNPLGLLKLAAGATRIGYGATTVAAKLDDIADTAAAAKGAALVGYDGATIFDFFKSKNNRVVDSITALKAIDKTKNTRVFVSGYYTAGDGGGGHYWYDSTDAVSADNGGTVIVATDGGRWKLEINGRVSVKVFGATGNGVTNDRPFFSAAVAAVLQIYVPSGTYLFSDATTVACRYGQDILGESSHSTLRPTAGLVAIHEGSVINITGTASSPFTYYSGNKFDGLTFYYPNQLRTAAAPTVYPPVFKWNAAGAAEVLVNNTWKNCQFVNAYSWIDCLSGHLDYEFENLTGCAISRGIQTDGCGGTDIFRNIRMSYYYWCQYADAAATWIQANAQGINVGRSDAVHMDRIYCGSMNVGLRFFVGSVNTATGPYGSITGLSLDGNNYGIYSEGTHGVGINITDLMCNSLAHDIEIAAGGAAQTIIQVAGFKLWGAKTNCVRINRASSTFRVSRGEMFSATAASVSVGVDSCDIAISSVAFLDTVVAPLATGAQCNTLMLSDNVFNMAPSLFATPATISRYRGNTYLADASVGA